MQATIIPTPQQIGAQPLATNLTTVSGWAADQTTRAGAIPSATSGTIEKTGANTFGTYLVTAFAKTLLDDADAATARGTLGLGTAATVNTGTTEGTIPVLGVGGLLGESRLPGAGLLRAWVRFDVMSGVVTVDGSSNVSSISIQSTGLYRVNFTTAMPTANYCALASKQNINTNNSAGIYAISPTTTSVEVLSIENNVLAEAVNVSVAVFY